MTIAMFVLDRTVIYWPPVGFRPTHSAKAVEAVAWHVVGERTTRADNRGSSLFHGGGLWSRLRFWLFFRLFDFLRFIFCLVVVPLFFIVVLVLAVVLPIGICLFDIFRSLFVFIFTVAVVADVLLVTLVFLCLFLLFLVVVHRLVVTGKFIVVYSSSANPIR
jgi:hypothetical protein